MKNLTFSKVSLSIAALALLAVFGLAGCGGGGGGGSGGANTGNTSGGDTVLASATIDTGGGTVSTPESEVTLQVPAGAVAASTTITIASSGDNAGQIGTLYQLTGQEGTELNFQQPVTIKLKYDPATLPADTREAGLQVGLLGPFDSWEILTDSTVDTVNKVITATTTHISDAAILVTSNSGNAALKLSIRASSIAGAGPSLSFPLPDRDPFTAVITSVFDHSMVAPYCEDGTIEAYTGDIGIIKSSCFTMEKNKATCGNNKTTQTLCDYGTGGNPVAYKNGNSDTTVISYDGHPGYDYRTKDQTSVDGITGHISVFAAASGTAHVITNWKFGTVWIDHGNGYSTHYLHLSGHLGNDGKDIDGKYVEQGEQIGIAGETNATGQPHLHFEVRQNNIPIDPYAKNLWSSTQSDITAPSAPTGLAATAASTTQINLIWTASPESDVAGYKVYKNGTYLRTVTSTSTSDTGLSASTQYCYTVSAYDTSNNESSPNSSACATTGSTPDTTPPTVSSTSPANIATNVAVNTAITATFSETMDISTVSSATFSLNNGGTGAVTYTGTTATVTPSSNLAYSTTYTATITTGVKDSAGNTMASNYSWAFTTAAAPVSAPSAPTGVSATAGNGQATISWNAVSGATSYNIYWSITSGVTKTNGTKISNATSPYMHTGRTNSTTYYYVVTAVNSYGESVESSQVSATTNGTGGVSYTW